VGSFGERNRIERWFRTMKARTRRFFNNFPAREKPIFKIKLFIKLFTLCYNFIRPNTKKTTSNTHNLTVSTG